MSATRSFGAAEGGEWAAQAREGVVEMPRAEIALEIGETTRAEGKGSRAGMVVWREFEMGGGGEVSEI